MFFLFSDAMLFWPRPNLCLLECSGPSDLSHKPLAGHGPRKRKRAWLVEEWNRQEWNRRRGHRKFTWCCWTIGCRGAKQLHRWDIRCFYDSDWRKILYGYTNLCGSHCLGLYTWQCHHCETFFEPRSTHHYLPVAGDAVRRMSRRSSHIEAWQHLWLSAPLGNHGIGFCPFSWTIENLCNFARVKEGPARPADCFFGYPVFFWNLKTSCTKQKHAFVIRTCTCTNLPKPSKQIFLAFLRTFTVILLQARTRGRQGDGRKQSGESDSFASRPGWWCSRAIRSHRPIWTTSHWATVRTSRLALLLLLRGVKVEGKGRGVLGKFDSTCVGSRRTWSFPQCWCPRNWCNSCGLYFTPANTI